MSHTLEITITKIHGPDERQRFLEWVHREDKELQKSGGVVKMSLPDHRRETISLLVTLQRMLAGALLSSRENDEFSGIGPYLPRLARTVGRHLFKVLFEEPEMCRGLALAIDRADRRKRDPLRIVIDFSSCDDAELESWPWEYLFDVDGNVPIRGYLCSQSQLVLQRRVNIAWPGFFPVPRPTVLLLVSKPRGEGDVVEGELPDKLKTLHERGLITLHELVQKKLPLEPQEHEDIVADFESFKDQLKERQPDVVHFIGHGTILKNGQGALAFMHPDNGQAQWIPGAEFADEVAANSNRRLVFLQACESAVADPHASMSSVAQMLVTRNVFAVLGMQVKISNAQGVAFAVKFYEELASGRSVDVAVRAGRAAVERIESRRDLSTSGQTPFAVPVLYLLREEPLFHKEERAANGGGRTQRTIAIDGRSECPYCHRPIDTSQNVCGYCELRLRCNGEPDKECGARYHDALNDKRCSQCGAPIVQRPRQDLGLPRPGSASQAAPAPSRDDSLFDRGSRPRARQPEQPPKGNAF